MVPAGLLLSLGTRLTAGCSGSDVHTVPVSGTVTLDGQAVSDVFVNFQPAPGAAAAPSASPGSYGITDASGRFELRWADGRGAVVGKHVVTLVYKDPNRLPQSNLETGMEAAYQFKLPPRARDGSIQFAVPKDGTEEADFAFDSSEMQTPPAGRSGRLR